MAEAKRVQTGEPRMVGRQMMTPDAEFDPRAEFAAQVDRHERERQEHARQMAEARADVAAAKRDAKEANIRTICVMRGNEAGLTREQTEKMIARLVAESRRCEANGLAFDPYFEILAFLHDAGKSAVPPTPRDANPITTQLPPPVQQRKSGVSAAHDPDTARRAEEAERAKARAERAAERSRRESEAYRKRLREAGLMDPAVGVYPGGGGGTGFGM